MSAVSTAACGKGPTRSQFSGPSSVQVLTPISGPRNCRVLSADLQVSGFWEWCLHLRQTAASYGREPIFINIDESSMPQFCKAKRGVCLRRSDWPAGKVPCGPRKPPRNTATLLAMISSEGTLQKCLPQILPHWQRAVLSATVAIECPSSFSSHNCTVLAAEVFVG